MGMRTRIAALVTAVVVAAFLLGAAGPAGAKPKRPKGGGGGSLANVQITSPITEGDTAHLTGNVNSTCSASQLTVTWGDGSPDQQATGPGQGTFDIPHLYKDDNPPGQPDVDTVTVTMSTPCGDADQASTRVTVNNAPPEIQTFEVHARGPRQTTSLDGTFTDPGVLDSFTVTIDWGDGTPVDRRLLPAIQKIRDHHVYESTGQYRVDLTVQDEDGGQDSASADIDVPVEVPRLITSPGAGGGPLVRVFDGSGEPVSSFFAYRSSFTGGVRVASGDVDGDGYDDVITAPGKGGPPLVEVFSGKDGSPIDSFFAFRSAFTGGVFVAAGDVNGDGYAEIIVGADAGGGPLVRVFDRHDGRVLGSFFAYQSSFTGGVRVAVGDVNGDGVADIITGAGAGGGPHVKVFDGDPAGGTLRSFFAYQSSFTGGVYVAFGSVPQ
jgi:PKD domain/FG-GAP-like repeat